MSRPLLLLLPLGVALSGAACADPAAPSCEGAGTPVARGTVATPALTEASGLAKSRVQEDLLWTHEDQGNDPVLHALGADGRDRGSLSLIDADNLDWEDLALGVDGTGAAALYVGDIGDNDGTRSEIQVLRLPEPIPPDDLHGADQTDLRPDVLGLTFPDGAVDAEALAFDPRSNELLLWTKEPERARLYRADALAEHGSTQVLTLVDELDLSADPWAGGRKVTAADLSPDGARLALRTTGHVLVFERGPDDTIEDALAAGPCLAPVPDEPEGEALALDADDLWTLSEGAAPTLWSVSLDGDT